jgi:chemotaxis protein CheX
VKFEYIKPFVDSTVRVLDEILQSDISKGKLSLVKIDEIYGEIVIVIKVEGDSDGDIILNMDEETALNISNVMLGENSDTLEPIGMDAISELANMMAGNAVSALTDLGFEIRITPPLIVARDAIMKKMLGLEIFQVPLYTESGEITMNAVLRVK